MRKINIGKKLLGALLALVLLLCSFPAVYAEDVAAEIYVEAAAESDAEEVAEEVLVVETEEISEEALVVETEEIPEEKTTAAPETKEIAEEEPAEASGDEWEDMQETAGEDEWDLVEFEDDDTGYVSEELLQEFNNPELYDTAEFGGNVEIEMKNSEIYYDRDVTLVARVSGTAMNHRIVWEANDGDGRGWFTVGSGPEYTFTVTRDIVDREYRVNLFTVD